MQPLLFLFGSILSVQAAFSGNSNAAAPVANSPVANAPVANAPAVNAPVANAPGPVAPVANAPVSSINPAQISANLVSLSAYMATATTISPDLQSKLLERQSQVSAFMATQTNSALAAAYASAQVTRTSLQAFMKTATPSEKAKAKEGFGTKMKDFFKKMQSKVQKKKTVSSVASDAVQPTATAVAGQ